MTVTNTHRMRTMRKVNKQQTIKITQKLRSVLSLDNGGDARAVQTGHVTIPKS